MYLKKVTIKEIIDIFKSNQIPVLIPYDAIDENEFKKIKIDEVIKCKIDKPRNYEHHKKYFALLKLCFDNLPDYFREENKIHSIEDLRINIYYEIGYTKKVKHIRTGKIIEIPDSINFETIGQKEFTEKVYNPTLSLICKLLNISIDKLENNILY